MSVLFFHEATHFLFKRRSVFVTTRLTLLFGETDLWSSELEECVRLGVCAQRVEIIVTRSRNQGQAEIREAKGK